MNENVRFTHWALRTQFREYSNQE